MKVGQTSTIERKYYETATQEKPDGTKCLQNFSRFGSDYRDRISQATKVGEYKVPMKDANTLRKFEILLIRLQLSTSCPISQSFFSSRSVAKS